MAPRKIIIDTDPGVDDILAMLLACSALPEELEVLLVSVTYGNIDVKNCLRNVVSLFYHIEKEIAFRKSQGLPLGFDTLRQRKPLVAVGPEHPLADQMLVRAILRENTLIPRMNQKATTVVPWSFQMADFFHGTDGLGGIHETHPHLSPAETWKQLFETTANTAEKAIASELSNGHALFEASTAPASEEILRLLRENDPDTITIVAVGPLTNLALAAAQDPEAFLRAKEVVVMGGNVEECGNITPGAEFNTFADSIAAARVYALSSPSPKSTMPAVPPPPPGAPSGQSPPPYLTAYPEKLSKQLKVTLFPLDVTNYHNITRGQFREFTKPLLASKSPLAEWVSAFLTSTFNKVETLVDVSGDAVGLQLHDPLCVWYCMTQPETWELIHDEDLRVETSGQWTRGMCIVDKRPRKKREDVDEGEKPGDSGNWLSACAGNRLRRCTASPGQDLFGPFLLRRVFGQSN